jgi:hypothetical protein
MDGAWFSFLFKFIEDALYDCLELLGFLCDCGQAVLDDFRVLLLGIKYKAHNQV